jgi:hypothetical protein
VLSCPLPRCAACTASALALLLATRGAAGAGPLSVEVNAAAADCPSPDSLRQELIARGLRGAVRLRLGAAPEGGFVGEVETRSEGGEQVTRQLSGPRCQTVAEGLVLIAAVHLGKPPEPAPPTPPEAPPPAPTPPWRPRVALGVLGTADTILSGSPAPGGGLAVWVSAGSRGPRGLALSVADSRQQITREVPIDLDHLRARLDLVPVEWPLGPSTHLAAGAFASGGSLRAEAEVAQRTPGRRALWVVGAGPRLRQHIGPIFAEIGAEGTATLTDRTFGVTGLGTSLFSLPRFGVGASLALGVPLGN